MDPQLFICPICFATYSSGQIIKERPTCPDCASEAIEMDVIPYDKFLADTPLADLEAILRRIEADTYLRESYRNLKADRVRQLIDKKK